jgi:nitrogen-specific signal transduction histidine kinase
LSHGRFAPLTRHVKRVAGPKNAPRRADTGMVTHPLPLAADCPAAGPALPDDVLVAADRWSLWRTTARGLGHGLANAAQMLGLDPLPAHAREEVLERVNAAIAHVGSAHRPPAAGPTVVDDVLAEVQTAQRLQAAFRSTELLLDIAPGLPAVSISAPDLAHVLLALVTNAKQAAGDERATIHVRARRTDAGVEIEIEDGGAGLPHDVRAHAFEPFVTSAPGVRLGLGLHVARLLARRAGGDVHACDERARFRVTLPAWTRPGASSAPTPSR